MDNLTTSMPEIKPL